MPMVPMFQQGLPTVQQSGGSGAMTVSMPTPDMSYQKTMAVAARPVAEFAGSLQKMAETQFARDVKAQSDEAETQAMQVINTALYDPENGYLTKKGKAAPDAYKGTLEGLKKDLGDITSRLPVPVREAVQSRINERGLNAENMMQRWNAQQTGQWHLQSSQSRKQTLLDDAALHWGDKDYLARTLASIHEEDDYQGQLQGFDADTVAQQKKASTELFHLGVLGAMSQDNPVGAFAQLRSLKGELSPAAYAKCESAIWQRAKPDLTMRLVQNVGQTMLSKKDFLRDAMRPGHKSGDPVIDGLSTAQKMDVYSAAYSFVATERSQEQAKASTRVQDSIGKAATYGYDPNPLTLDDFAAYGDKAQERYDKYVEDFTTASAVGTYQDLPALAIKQDLDASKPQPGDADFAEKKKRWNLKAQAAEQVIKERSADPVGAAVSRGYLGFQALNFSDTKGMVEQLKLRAGALQQLSDEWGTPRRLFAKDEAKALVEALDKSDINGRCALLATISSAIGKEGIRAAADQLRSGKTEYALAMAAFDQDDGMMTVGEKYLRGLDAIATKQVFVDDKAEVGVTASIYQALGELYLDPTVRDATAQLVKGVYGYTKNVNEAIKQVVGTLQSFHGKNVVLPRGVDTDGLVSSDFETLVSNKADEFRKETKELYYLSGHSLTGPELGDLLGNKDVKLQTYGYTDTGGVQYYIYANGQFVRGGKDLTPVLITLEAKDLPESVFKLKKKTRIEADEVQENLNHWGDR